VTKHFMENKTTNGLGGLVCGRALNYIAKKSMANMKKALAFLTMMPEVEEDSTEGVTYKFGNSEDEVKTQLLDLMSIELNGKADEFKLDDDDEDSNKNNDVSKAINTSRECDDGRTMPSVKTHPIGWFFQTGFHFVYLGLL
jgi:hypothetical protein